MPAVFRHAVWIAREATLAWSRHGTEREGAALAFYALFSMAPTLLVLSSLLGFFLGEQAARGELENQLSGLLGPEPAATAQELMQAAHQPGAELGAVLIGSLTLVWGATRGFVQLQGALDEIANRGGSPLPPPALWRRRAAGVLAVAGLGLLMVLSMALTTALNVVMAWLDGRLPLPPKSAFFLNDLCSLFVLATGFFGVYRLLPSRPLGTRDLLVGSLTAAALFTLGRHGIAFYLGRTNPGSAWGASGGLVVLLLWLYYSALILLFGAEISLATARFRGRAPTTPAPEG